MHIRFPDEISLNDFEGYVKLLQNVKLKISQYTPNHIIDIKITTVYGVWTANIKVSTEEEFEIDGDPVL